MILQNFNFEEGLEKAKARAELMVKNGLYSRFGLSYSQRLDKALLGCLGEIAFEFFLNQNGIEYETDHTDFTTKNTDEFDFKIGNKIFDIKVAKKSTSKPPSDSWTYGYPQEQNPISKDYVVVGWIDFNNKEIGFYGWISGMNISKYKVVTVNSFAGYAYLTPNHEFPWGALNKNLSLTLKH